MYKTPYPRLALANLKRNKKFYLPYLLASIFTVMLFCIMLTLQQDPALAKMSGGQQVQLVLALGCIVIGVLAAILLFYTNSTLTKQRKKEFGLYNILGMGKRHIGRVLFWESFYTALVAIIVGIAGSLLFSKLAQLLLMRLLKMNVGFEVNIQLVPIIITVILFLGLFALILLNTLRIIHVSNPAELLRGTNEGEREPKSKWLLALFGVIFLAAGYIMSLKTSSAYAAIVLFFVAVICVIIGTYLIFTAFSIVFLKGLRRNKGYYYKTNHFATVSGMLYRMKRNAAGLASICILSTMVLVTVSTTVCLYAGVGDIVERRFPKDIIITCSDAEDPQTLEDGIALADRVLAREGRTPSDYAAYRYLDIAVKQEGSKLIVDDSNMSSPMSSALAVWVTTDDYYSSLTGENYDLNKGEALAYCDGGPLGDSIELMAQTYSLKYIKDFPVDSGGWAMGIHTLYLVVDSEDTFMQIYEGQKEGYSSYSTIGGAVRFNLDGTDEEKMAFGRAMVAAVADDSDDFSGYVADKAAEAQGDFYSFYGAFFFLGLFLGLVFILATVLIIYYKQISEGYDDRRRFEIMQKVGMTRQEVKATIRSQVLIVFFLPLVTAGIHVLFAFPMVKYIMAAFGMGNVKLFLFCILVTMAVFAVLYVIVYILTSRSYYQIVSEAGEQ